MYSEKWIINGLKSWNNWFHPHLTGRRAPKSKSGFQFCKTLSAFFLLIIISACQNQIDIQQESSSANLPNFTPLYSALGKEHEVSFKANYRTDLNSLEDYTKLSESQKNNLVQYGLNQTISYLFGPLTRREIGAPQKGTDLKIHWDEAYLNQGLVEIPFTYSGTWLIVSNYSLKGSVVLPFPYNSEVVFSENWKMCTDSEPDHQTRSFYWYFWDPSRPGCDQQKDLHFQDITVYFGKQTPQLTNSRPEYSKLINSASGDKSFNMTFAFGYVEDSNVSNPDKDYDSGVEEYRKFLRYLRTQLKPLGFSESAISSNDYKNANLKNLRIGSRFSGQKSGVNINVNVVVNAGVDQMQLFAQSFAHDHDSFFGWFGHSRVGGGFDANQFRSIISYDREYYSISKNYQIIYWAGCNSYSYYTLPFFKFKADANPQDARGTKGLDIISNGLPSLFSYNAENAKITFGAMFNWENNSTYKEIIDRIEGHASNTWGTSVLVNVLGDEDNK